MLSITLLLMQHFYSCALTEAEDALEMARYTGVPGPRGKVSAGAMKAATGATQGLLGELLLRVYM
jgi:hypothetical protein